MHTSSHGRFYIPPGPKRLRVRRVRSRSAAESVCGLDVNQNLSQPTKYIPLTVHQAPSSRNCQQHRMWELGYTWPLELARETELRWKNHLFLLKLKACAGQWVTLFERLDWKTPCLMHTLANQLRLSQKDTCAFYASVDGLSLGTIKSWHILIYEIRVERSHLMFCTNCHKIDITAGYCSWVEIHPYKKKQYVEFSMLHRHLISSFVSWYNRQVLLLLMICVHVQSYLVSMATTYL